MYTVYLNLYIHKGLEVTVDYLPIHLVSSVLLNSYLRKKPNVFGLIFYCDVIILYMNGTGENMLSPKNNKIYY